MGRIAVVGAGMMGTALCWPLCDNGHTVRLVGTPLDQEVIHSIRSSGIHPKLERSLPAGIETFFHSDLPEALAGVDVVVCGVSSFGVDWFNTAAGPFLRSDVPVLAVTKGLAVLPDGDLQPLPDYINSRLPAALQDNISLNAIAGPCIAHELAARRQTCVVFTGKNRTILEQLQGVFETPYYHIRNSVDMKEVEICAALKNGYALAIGIAAGMADREGTDGLANMYNPQAAVFAQSCQEMRMLIEKLKGNGGHVSWLPGAGDLYVTVFGGRTRRLGVLIGQGRSAAEALHLMQGVTLESVEIVTRVAAALRILEERRVVEPGQFPLLKFLDALLNQGAKASFPWDEFFSTSFI